jgi:hypothetical protein
MNEEQQRQRQLQHNSSNMNEDTTTTATTPTTAVARLSQKLSQSKIFSREKFSALKAVMTKNTRDANIEPEVLDDSLKKASDEIVEDEYFDSTEILEEESNSKLIGNLKEDLTENLMEEESNLESPTFTTIDDFLSMHKEEVGKSNIEEMGYISRDIQPYKKICSPPPLLRSDLSIASHLKKLFHQKNLEKFPRYLCDDSRDPFSEISAPDSILQDIRELFFEKDGDKLAKSLSKDFNSKQTIIPSYITLEEKVKIKDKRIQVEFKEESLTFKKVSELLSSAKLFNPEFEVIEDVSLLIGGTADQKIHCDIPRLFCFFNNGTNPENLVNLKDALGYFGHEINRKFYNDAVSSKYGHSSIIIDLSSEQLGFHLTIPKYLIEKICNDHCTIKYCKGIYKITKKQPQTVTICVLHGCQFVGDFFHTEANNITKDVKNDFDKLYKHLVSINMNAPLFNALIGCPSLSKKQDYFAKHTQKDLNL